MEDETHGASSTHLGEDSAIHDEDTASIGDASSSSGWTTTKQAAKALGVSRRSVQEYVRRGLLEARVEGEGVNKTFYVSIDSLNTLRNQRSGEVHSPDNFAEGASKHDETTNPSPNVGEALRHAIDRLEVRTAEATELRIRLELTERAQSTLEEQLAEERRRREEAERRAEELARRLETPQSPESAADEPTGTYTGTADRERETEFSRPQERSWWRRWFGIE